MLVPPLPLPVNVRWRIDPDMPGGSATRWLTRAAGDVAERQHGVVSRGQLRALGAPDAAIDELVRARALRCLHAGVYAVGHRAVTQEGRMLAALLACGENASLSHSTAAATWGYCEHDDEVHLTVVDDVHHERPGIRPHRSRTLGREDVTTYRKLTLTRPARTLIDHAAVVSRLQAYRTADRAMRGGCTPAALRDALDRHPRQPGRCAMALYLATRRAAALKVRSELERRAAELLLASDLPVPLFNPVIEVVGEWLEVDVWWPERRLVLELDGRAYHEGVAAELEDARRDALLRAGGQRVRRAAWWDVDREPGRLLTALRSEVRRSLADRP